MSREISRDIQTLTLGIGTGFIAASYIENMVYGRGSILLLIGIAFMLLSIGIGQIIMWRDKKHRG